MCACRLHRLASARALPRGVAHVRVAADADFTLTLRGSGGGAGERYAAIFRADGSKCELLFLRQQTAPAGARRYVREASYRPRQEPACK
jgi:hypothetical protein